MEKRLPFQEVIEEGLKTLSNQGETQVTLPALIVSIGAPKLKSLGFRVVKTISHPERKLYELLSKTHPDRSVHSLYNSYIRRLVSFERAVACVKPRIKNASAG